ncbi:20-hydroxy-prefusarin hydrolase FUS2 [Fusarium oxysporum f. sp. albedinis]|nr:20-hydroxy-prefusarin hydrolase FUS2 [Fusarium oxysporum f. sp. albedinis]
MAFLASATVNLGEHVELLRGALIRRLKLLSMIWAPFGNIVCTVSTTPSSFRPHNALSKKLFFSPINGQGSTATGQAMARYHGGSKVLFWFSSTQSLGPA